MNIVVNWEESEKLKATFNSYEVFSDASKKNGGHEEYPEPADYLYVSLALCAAFYLRKFLVERKIDVSACRLEINTAVAGEGYKRSITYKITLPTDFPDKYRPVLIKVLEGCSVKKIVEAGIEFNYNIN